MDSNNDVEVGDLVLEVVIERDSVEVLADV